MFSLRAQDWAACISPSLDLAQRLAIVQMRNQYLLNEGISIVAFLQGVKPVLSTNSPRNKTLYLHQHTRQELDKL